VRVRSMTMRRRRRGRVPVRVRVWRRRSLSCRYRSCGRILGRGGDRVVAPRGGQREEKGGLLFVGYKAWRARGVL
jgi:hypothetical protein